MTKILIGSNNQGKIKKWERVLSDYITTTPKDIGLKLTIDEGFTSLIDNSQKKALTYATESNLITLSDDTGCYIEELDGLPGVAVRRWGGELSDDISDEDYFEFFKEKLMNLDNTQAYFDFAVSIAAPDGRVRTITNRLTGHLDKSRINAELSKGFPFSGVFVSDYNGKTWSESTKEERYDRDKEFNGKIIKELKEFIR